MERTRLSAPVAAAFQVASNAVDMIESLGDAVYYSPDPTSVIEDSVTMSVLTRMVLELSSIAVSAMPSQAAAQALLMLKIKLDQSMTELRDFASGKIKDVKEFDEFTDEMRTACAQLLAAQKEIDPREPSERWRAILDEIETGGDD